MGSIRVTKYDPKNRDASGCYTLSEEWTSMSDVGKTFDGRVFTMAQYVETEDNYIRAIDTVMEQLSVTHLKVASLENHFNETDLELTEGEIIPKHLAMELARMVLREKVWAKLIAEDQVEVHFGHDYYMYVVGESLTDAVIEELKEIEGLYVEEVSSPYVGE